MVCGNSNNKLPTIFTEDPEMTRLEVARTHAWTLLAHLDRQQLKREKPAVGKNLVASTVFMKDVLYKYNPDIASTFILLVCIEIS